MVILKRYAAIPVSIRIDHGTRLHAVIRKGERLLWGVGRSGRQCRAVSTVEEALDDRPLAVPILCHQVVHARITAVSVLASLGTDHNKD